MTRVAHFPSGLLAVGLASLLAGGAAWADDTPSDARIADAAKAELILDASVTSASVDLESQDGIVQLTGTVPHLMAKERAVEIVKTVRGVRGVVDRLRLEPTGGVPDARLQVDVERALLDDAATDLYELVVEAHAGVIELKGTVDSYPERALAERVAKGVRGVQAVHNAIRVDYAQERTDLEILADVQGMLCWDALVDAESVEVEVVGDVVTLGGVLGSAAERDRAIRLAWVAGVQDVVADALEIEPWARDPLQRPFVRMVVDDPSIVDAVEDALFHDPRANSFAIDTECLSGVVTLTGTVDNLKAKRAAGMTAWNVMGVRDVENRIEVLGSELADEALETRIERALKRDPYCELAEIEVEVANGVAELRGEVDSAFERAQADDVASRVQGVIDVENELRIESHLRLGYRPHVHYDWYIYDFPWHRADELLTPADGSDDDELREAIESQLFWSPFVDADQVQVEVSEGVATLRGTVDSWSERSAAYENALEGGARAVQNRLEVDDAEGE